MQITQLRYAVLALVFVGGIALYAAAGRPPLPHAARWPSEAALTSAAEWAAGPALAPQATSSYPLMSRRYMRDDGTSATLTVMTGSDPKIYRAGADVPFLGSGFAVVPVPAGLIPDSPGRQALLARRGSEQWLLLYTYGERRGLLGNGFAGWTLAVTDGLLSRPNDYYKLFLSTDLQDDQQTKALQVAQLADTLFPRVAADYARDV